MAKYFIPEPVKPGFKSLIHLDQKEVEIITKKMTEFEIGSTPSEFYALMRTLEIEDIDDISRAIFSFSGLLADPKNEPEALASGLLDGYYTDNKEVRPENAEAVLLSVFNYSKALETTFKAYSLSDEFKHSYRESMIVTDIRVVFDNPMVAHESRNAIITQQLKIEYNTDSDRHTIFINIQKSELEELKAQIERALEKEALLTSDYGKVFNFVQVKV